MPIGSKPSRAAPPSTRATSRCARACAVRFRLCRARSEEPGRHRHRQHLLQRWPDHGHQRQDPEIQPGYQNSELEEGKYQVHGSPVRGSADRVTMTNNNQNITLEGLSTPPAAGSGSVDPEGGQHRHRSDRGVREAWNASLWLYDYPVFYFPYINFPIKDERKTGLLYRVIPRAPRTAWISPSRSTGT